MEKHFLNLCGLGSTGEKKTCNKFIHIGTFIAEQSFKKGNDGLLDLRASVVRCSTHTLFSVPAFSEDSASLFPLAASNKGRINWGR